MNPNQVHRRVDAALARALQVQDDRVLARLMGQQIGIIAAMFLAGAANRTFDGRRLVEENVIGHRRCPRRRRAPGCPAAPR
jgi:hypothetical protein